MTEKGEYKEQVRETDVVMQQLEKKDEEIDKLKTELKKRYNNRNQ